MRGFDEWYDLFQKLFSVFHVHFHVSVQIRLRHWTEFLLDYHVAFFAWMWQLRTKAIRHTLVHACTGGLVSRCFVDVYAVVSLDDAAKQLRLGKNDGGESSVLRQSQCSGDKNMHPTHYLQFLRVCLGFIPHFTIMCHRNNPAILLEENVVAPSILPEVMNYITGERRVDDDRKPFMG